MSSKERPWFWEVLWGKILGLISWSGKIWSFEWEKWQKFCTIVKKKEIGVLVWGFVVVFSDFEHHGRVSYSIICLLGSDSVQLIEWRTQLLQVGAIKTVILYWNLGFWGGRGTTGSGQNDHNRYIYIYIFTPLQVKKIATCKDRDTAVEIKKKNKNWIRRS